MNDVSDTPRLENIIELIGERIKKYENMSLLEQYGMFMGKAQILEMGLKNVLARNYGFNLEATDKWTLGRTAKEMKKVDVRPDFIALLDSVVDLRNYITHELLANEVLLQSMTGGESGRLERRHLEKGIFELEQIIIIFDWQEKHDAWV